MCLYINIHFLKKNRRELKFPIKNKVIFQSYKLELMRELSYSQNKERDVVNRSIGKFIKSYCKDNYNTDWNYFITLTYKYPKIKESWCNNNVKKLVKEWMRYDKSVDGIMVNELENNMVGIHHHIILKIDLMKSIVESVTNKIWRNNGIVDVREYDSSYEFCYCDYMTKHIGKTNNNSYHFLFNFKE